MELAFLLIIVCLVNLVLSVYLVGRVRDYLRRLRVLEEVVNDISIDDKAATPVEVPATVVPHDMAEILAKATPEDIAQAQAILDKLGIKA